MFDIVGKRYLYFIISLLIIIPGLVAIVYSIAIFGSPFRLSIDFTGGSFWELQFERQILPGEVREVFDVRGLSDTSVQTAGDGNTAIIRSKEVDNETKLEIEQSLREAVGPFTERQFESVGPAVGREVTRSASFAIFAAAAIILLFIIFSFRKVANSFRYGVCAIVAMIHDILVVIGLFSIFSLAFHWEADALFLTALLTVVGFSVQDTIVVFDRIRENIPKRRGEPFEVIVNRSLLETLHRSLATQLNAMFVLIAILLFGGATIKQFVTVLLFGLLSGTYSSLFNAVPLLVVWQNDEFGRFFRRLFGRKATGGASA